MKKIMYIILSIVILFLTSFFIHADVIMDVYADGRASETITKVYFEKNNRPFNKPINFTVTCYGYSWRGQAKPAKKEQGTYTPEKVYSFSANCPNYGCEIYENYYLNYRHVDYCNLEGKTAFGQKFIIENYGSSPIDFSKCQRKKKTENKGGDLFPPRECIAKFAIPDYIY